MEYKVSEQVRQKFDALVKDEKVQKALKFMAVSYTHLTLPTNSRV